MASSRFDFRVNWTKVYASLGNVIAQAKYSLPAQPKKGSLAESQEEQTWRKALSNADSGLMTVWEEAAVGRAGQPTAPPKPIDLVVFDMCKGILEAFERNGYAQALTDPTPPAKPPTPPRALFDAMLDVLEKSGALSAWSEKQTLDLANILSPHSRKPAEAELGETLKIQLKQWQDALLFTAAYQKTLQAVHSEHLAHFNTLHQTLIEHLPDALSNTENIQKVFARFRRLIIAGVPLEAPEMEKICNTLQTCTQDLNLRLATFQAQLSHNTSHGLELFKILIQEGLPSSIHWPRLYEDLRSTFKKYDDHLERYTHSPELRAKKHALLREVAGDLLAPKQPTDIIDHKAEVLRCLARLEVHFDKLMDEFKKHRGTATLLFKFFIHLLNAVQRILPKPLRYYFKLTMGEKILSEIDTHLVKLGHFKQGSFKNLSNKRKRRASKQPNKNR